MNFKDFTINRSYKSVGSNSIPTIVNDLLYCTKTYRRSVGYFSSSALDFISSGINDVINNNGHIKLITSPLLNEEDIKAIKLGYKHKDDVLIDNFNCEFELALRELNDDKLKFLAELISYNILDIKIVTKKDGIGYYHDKVAILDDCEDNVVVFVGSNNETANGYAGNYEKTRVFKSWEHHLDVEDEVQDFENIWNGQDLFLNTLEFSDALKNKVLEILNERNINNINLDNLMKASKEKYKLYDYQKDARNAWVNNGYKGFFVMATGTGKTITSIYSIKELFKKVDNVITVIAVPYKHLVTQWAEDVEDIFGDEVVVHLVSGEIDEWDKKLKSSLLQRNYNNGKKIIIISTISSFYTDRFDSVMKLNKDKRLLIVDEAHNFLNKIINNAHDIDYEYKLGLSATPVFGTDSSKTDLLCDFFGGIVYSLPIEKAIGKFLVNYYYTPLFIHASEEDESKFNRYTQRMMSLRDSNGKIKNIDDYTKAYRGRLRCISMADEKMEKINEIISKINTPDHFIVYCSDGKIGDKKHLETIIDILNDHDFKPSKFTCSENMKERESLIRNFNAGYISSLVAIRCLDEGINIPSIKTALILSSNDNYREFVQRRGRILRKYEDENGKKTDASIIDVIVLPSKDCISMAKIEFRRYFEYAKVALNSESLIKNLNNYMAKYGLTYDDIKFDNDYLQIEENENDE